MVTQHNNMSTKEYDDANLKIEMKFDDTEKNKEISKIILNPLEIKVFRRRWLELILFVLYSATNNVQTNQYTIISNIMQRYYGVSSFAIEWTAMMLPVAYIVLIIPISQLIDRFGLRWTVSIGATLTCLGSWVKFFGSSSDHFIIAFIGHAMIATSQVVIFIVPGRLAACWFGPEQIASATAIAYAGIQIGSSVCFAFTAMVIKNHEKIEDIGKDLYNYSFVQAIVCTGIFMPVIVLFQNGPPLPPSETRAFQKKKQETDRELFWPQIKRILSNRSFILLWNSYGVILGAITAMIALLNPLYLTHFKNGEMDVGRLCLDSSIAGVISSACSAFILDKTKKFREMTIFFCFFALLASISFDVSLTMEIRWMVFVSFTIFGVAIISYTTVGLELCVEMTYPESEGISLGMLTLSIHIYGIFSILVSGRLLEAYGYRVSSMYLGSCLMAGTLLTVLNKGELRRQKALQTFQYDPIPLQVIQPMKTELRNVVGSA